MSSDSLRPYTDAVDYPATTAVDLNTDASPHGFRGPCRAIMPLGNGSLVVVLAGSGGQVRTLAVSKDVLEKIQATALHATNNIPVRVYW